MALERTVKLQGQGAAWAARDVAVLRCQGEMGELELAHVGEELFRLSVRGCHKVVLDLGGVDHVAYKGLEPLAARARLLRRSGGDIKLCGLSPYLAAIFRAAGVGEEFGLFRTVEEARQAFAEAPVLALVRG